MPKFADSCGFCVTRSSACWCPVNELALPRRGRELDIGLLLGFGLITVCVLIALALGICRIEGIASWKSLLGVTGFAKYT